MSNTKSQSSVPMEQTLSPAQTNLMTGVLKTILPDLGLQQTALDTLSKGSLLRPVVNSVVATADQNTAIKLKLVVSLFEITDGNGQLVSQVAKDAGITTLQQFAARYYTSPNGVNPFGLTTEQTISLKTRLYALEPTGVIYNLVVARGSIPAKECTQAAVQQVFDVAMSNDFNFRRDNARKLGLAVESNHGKKAFLEVSKVITFVKAIQRLQAVVEEPEDIGPLLKSGLNLQSAQHIAAIPKDALAKELKQLGLAEAKVKTIYDRASIIATRNEMAWSAILKSRTETAVGAVRADGASNGATAKSEHDSSSSLQANQANAINYGNVFDEIDAAECDDCSSILSPSAYFVDLLQRLGKVQVKSNATPTPAADAKIKTLYDQLVARRPDLGGLKLSCANTNTPIKYIDLVNEVLESFITLTINTNISNAVKIKTYDQDVVDGCSGPIKASPVPQNVNMQVYTTLAKTMVAPMHTFPYNHALDTVRSLLAGKGLSLSELLDVMKPYVATERGSPTAADASVGSTCARARAAEYLNLQHEDFLAITREAFEALDSVRDRGGPLMNLTRPEYEGLVGVRTTAEYWGFQSDQEMLSITSGTGLSNIARQLLPRAGISLQDLIAILKTNFMGGRLIITPTDGMNNHSDRLKNMTLRSSALIDPKEGALSVELCHDLQAFIRLRRLSGLPIEVLDVAVSCLSENGASGTNSIDGSVIEKLAAVKKLAKLVKLEIDEILPLWGDINTNGPTSLYQRLFLRQQPTGTAGSFQADDKGYFLLPASAPAFSEQRSFLASIFDVEVKVLDVLGQHANLKADDKLSVSNISLLYRMNLVCDILEIDREQFARFSAALPLGTDLFENPQSTLAVVSTWSTLKASGWNQTELFELFAKSSEDNSHRYRITALQVLQSLSGSAPTSSLDRNDGTALAQTQRDAYGIFKATFADLSPEHFLKALADARVAHRDGDPIAIVNVFGLVTGSQKPLAESAVSIEAVAVVEKAYEAVAKISLLSKKFELTTEEVQDILSSTSAVMHGFDIGGINLCDASRLQKYKELKKSVAKGCPGPLQFLKWAQTLTGRTGYVHEQISSSMGWNDSKVQTALEIKHGSATESKLADIYSDVVQLKSLHDIIDFTLKPGLGSIPLDQLFTLAQPRRLEKTLEESFQDAVSFRNVVTPTSASGIADLANTALGTAFDTLREHRRSTLTNYLLNQQYFIDKGFVTGDNLFEFFWIDVNMGASLETSRIKQAISTIQLFVHRCLMGMESAFTIHPDYLIDFQKEWQTLSKYTLWEANRRVFLFPENWADPTLRENKTELFKDFESAISRNDISIGSISAAIRDYVYGLNTVANLNVQAYLWERGPANAGNFHFFARTRTSPYQFYYRKMQVIDFGEKFPRWQAWEKVDLSVRPFEVDSTGKTVEDPGCYMIPVMIRGRLYLFIPQLERKVTPARTPDQSITLLAEKKPSELNIFAEHHWEIKLAWSEYRNGKWSPSVTSPAAIRVDKTNTGNQLPEASQFQFRVRTRDMASTTKGADKYVSASYGPGIDGVLVIDVDAWSGAVDGATTSYKSYRVGRFEMTEMTLSAVSESALTKPADSKTLPTSFSKLPWSVSAQSLVPTYSVTNPSGFNSALLANAEKQEASKICWTVSFDDSQYAKPTALVLDIQTKAGGHNTYFARPSDNLVDKTSSEESKSTVYFSRFDNPVSPRLVDVASAGDDLEAVYKTVNGLRRGTEGESVNQSEAEIFASTFGLHQNSIYQEEISSYSQYTWEMGVHMVSLLMETLQSTQQFDLALRVARLAFDPSIHGTRTNRCWKFAPFQDTSRIGVKPVKELLQSLQSSEKGVKTMTDVAIYNWRQRPFDPHTIARGRPVTYMKRIIMKYIEILLDAGDVHFRQNTMESIPLALQRYVEASHLFGPRPTRVPKLGTRTPKSYIGLKRLLDTFSNASIDMELEFPFCVVAGAGSASSDTTPLAGILNTTYFCVPQNPKLAELIDRIDDRLFKIRNGRDINGNAQRLALFEAPMDPGALVASAAKGALSSALLMADADSPMPNYRFQYLLQKALELCNEIKSVESAYLAAVEKKDAEALSLLKTQQDMALQNALAESKKLQKDEAVITLTSQQEARKSHESRLRFYLALMGEPDKVPGFEEEWVDIQQSFGRVTKCDLRMNTWEKEEMEKTNTASDRAFKASALEGTGSILRLLPQTTVHASLFGVGPALKIDSYNVADSLKGASTVLQLLSQISGSEGSQAGRKGQMIRQLQERRHQANQAGRDIKSADRQIAAAKVRVAIAEADGRQQALVIKHAAESDAWLRSKYANEALYAWMEKSIRTTAYETYKLAAQYARQVEKTYLFESTGTTSRFLRPEGYWDSARGGLGAAQALYLDLKKMEAAYIQNPSYSFEITKSVSLRQINPLALLELRTTGTCKSFSVPEMLFDMDFPGHYMRRIKSVSVTVPCVFGPHASLNCTLTLLSHKYRVSPSVGDSYAERQVGDDRFRQGDPVPVKSVAISSGQQDAGVFELNFYGERYLPFEGAGVISEWKMELPTAVRQFDYETIADVVLQFRYTSRSDELLKSAAEDAVRKQMEAASKDGKNLYAYFDVVNDFPGEWYSAIGRPGGSGNVVMGDMMGRMPFWARDIRRKVVATKIHVVTDAKVNEVVIQPSEGKAVTLKTEGLFQLDQPDLYLIRSSGALRLEVSSWTVSLSQEAAQKAKKFYLVMEYSVKNA
ncbi:hypothetical protein QBC35DRAFT_545257 [Podospora australis]|uniref:Toxin subunit n=1 Tax=Podospora australis TaxID=1536484 RepID=A0AAN7ADA8_9PEZI|nr:hypothetical protein QBC35DRAFT_545257 [Podospora australis]